MHKGSALSPPPHTPPRTGTFVQGDGCATSGQTAAQTATPLGGSVVQPSNLKEEIKKHDENLFNFITAMQKTFDAKLTHVQVPGTTIGNKYPRWADDEMKNWMDKKPVGVFNPKPKYRGKTK
ncbi:hypothetical protein UFOVP605_21 [uncultured Caudovirales phage]|uniref:Uncharacterized protein n=1 Tax=uncultured Caudovirales phage TaxID=2100421 RepID=A0A6J5N6A6_9CAUD|nr:hypothetical protein UFOVP605_21 [uncultured Caudovirales phage]